MTFEKFAEKFNELENAQKVALYNDYEVNYGDPDRELHTFDEEFFNLYFEGREPIEVCRATVFGNVNWSHEYIGFNAYGNLKSVNEWEAEEMAEDAVHEIYEHEELWQFYIDDDEEEDEEETDEE